MRWILRIAGNLKSLLWKLRHTKENTFPISEDEFLGYEAFSLQAFMPASCYKEHEKKVLSQIEWVKRTVTNHPCPSLTKEGS